MRKYVSLFLLWSLIALIFTGIVQYIMPHGRVAYWTDWRLLGLDKDQWTSIHIVFALIMLVAGILHIYLNWNSIVRYLKGVGSKLLTTESLITALVSITLLITSIYNLPPSKTLMDLQSKIKDSWAQPAIRPPLPHAELLTLNQLAKRLKVSPDRVMALLKAQGVKAASPEETLKELARRNHSAPDKIYSMLLKALGKGTPSSQLPTTGLGKLTLKETCQRLGIPVSRCVGILKHHGIAAQPQETLKELASSLGKTPYELVEMLKGEKR